MTDIEIAKSPNSEPTGFFGWLKKVFTGPSDESIALQIIERRYREIRSQMDDPVYRQPGELFVEVKALREPFDTPNELLRGSEEAAAYDLRADLSVSGLDSDRRPMMMTIPPGETVMIGTGLAISIEDPNVAAFLFPRSGKGAKEGLVLGNGTGVIDPDYQGEIKIAATNRNKTSSVIVRHGERIAQLAFLPVLHPTLIALAPDEEFEKVTDRGAGGFGSTGK